MNYLGSDKIDTRKVTTLRLQEMKDKGQKIACLTAYDSLIARIIDESGIDIILVGDSLGNVFQGNETTISVTLEETIYHTKAVVKGVQRSMVVADMPFMTYQVSANEAFTNAGRILKETGASAIKLEGGKRNVEAVERMTELGIPVMGHLGLTPQSIHKFGSYRARGTSKEEADAIYNDALLLQEAGVFSIILEKIPAELAKRITASLRIPTIGIGAGPFCDGQILVYTDMLGLTVEFSPRFVRRYALLKDEIINAVTQYSNDVRDEQFPSIENESY